MHNLFVIFLNMYSCLKPIDNLLEVLVDQYGCECNRRDIQRMELIVMHKLEFDLSRPTAQDFLKSVSIICTKCLDYLSLFFFHSTTVSFLVIV